MSEMQCAGVRRNLQSAMCAMSKMQCVPSSRKTYPCQYNHALYVTRHTYSEIRLAQDKHGPVRYGRWILWTKRICQSRTHKSWETKFSTKILSPCGALVWNLLHAPPPPMWRPEFSESFYIFGQFMHSWPYTSLVLLQPHARLIDMDMSYVRMVRTASLTSYPVRCKM
jgi:hypothetical protein